MVSTYKVSAHVIRNASTKQFTAVCSLVSLLRWGLTATPIQNSLDDLGSLIRFLKLPVLEEPAQFKRHIIGPVEKTTKDYRNLTKVLGSVCLRRTKAVLSLSPVTDTTHWINFEPEERAEYTQIERTCRDALDLAVSGHKVKEAHQTVLEILLRLRLFCNNGSTYDTMGGNLSGALHDTTETLCLLQQRGEAICCFCSCDVGEMQDIGENGDGLVTPCSKVVCADCTPVWRSESLQRNSCSICNKQHSTTTTELAIPQPSGPNGKYPSKMLALCEDILAHKSDGKW
jgi:SWI/SNF-related matrix-associated actin-dependent regulator of chromatin subfamily A3